MIAVAATSAAIAAWLLLPPPRRRRRGSGWPGGPAKPHLSRGRIIALVCAGLGVVTAIAWGGPVGIALGLGVAVAGPRVLSRLESRRTRRQRQALERQVPTACDLLASCLTAGATPSDAVRAVADALGDPVAVTLRRLVSALDLGADPAAAWSALAEEPTLRPVARAAARSAQTGAPLAALLAAVADDQRDEARARAEAAARAAGVRSVAPLAACFLPAFLLIGIVPVVASLALPLLG